MPELPEVQCVVNSLQRVVGKKISRVEVLASRLREPFQVDLGERLQGRTVRSVRRYGKYLVFDLDQGCLVAHLGMTGKFLIDAQAGTHDRAVISFEDGTRLVYNDVRKFGFILFEDDFRDNKYIKKLGIEPLGDDFSVNWLLPLALASRKNAKQFLLDQSIIAGLGNIYVIEVLYLCRISPLREMRDLSKGQLENLVHQIKTILLDSIQKGGSSISDYRDADNQKGSFQDGFHVYGRKKDQLGNDVVKITQNGRSTYYCPNVQK
ncbi:MAG: bifunctional DNA-formamidopyrimidine glycosylase/DNA-(apurinic or apyrimidinic site) lyase [Hafnia sp.]